MYNIISYYTTNYKPIFEKYLLPSLIGLNLDNYTEEVPNFSDWNLATNYKPTFIKQCLNKFSENLLFTDADSSINSQPILIDNLDKDPDIDFAFHNLDKFLHYGRPKDVNQFEFLSGTLFFRNNTKTKELVDLWIRNLSLYSPEQKALQAATTKFKDLGGYVLPREYCYLMSQPTGLKPATPLDSPIISHYQASREKHNLYKR